MGIVTLSDLKGKGKRPAEPKGVRKRSAPSRGVSRKLPSGHAPTAGRDGTTLEPATIERYGACLKCHKFGHFISNCGWSREQERGPGYSLSGGGPTEVAPAGLTTMQQARLARFETGSASSPPPAPALTVPEAAVATGAGSAAAAAASSRGDGPSMGDRVKVWWEGDEKWFEGTVDKFNQKTGKYRVTYDDGDQRWYRLGDDDDVQWEPLRAAAAPAAGGASAACGAPGPSMPTPPAAASRVEDSASGTRLCIVCMDEKITHAFQPCGHLSCCVKCCGGMKDARLRMCPKCQQPYTHTQRIWQE